MNIKDNLTNYLFDKEYIIALYDDYFYIKSYKYLEEFDDSTIIVRLKNKRIKIYGNDLHITKITKEELLIKGIIERIDIRRFNE